MFCTFFLGVLNLRNGRLDYCNAGHDAPIIIRKRENGYEPEFIGDRHNLVLGAIDGLDEIHRHTKGNLQSDDITMLMVEYKGATITLENKIEQLPLLSRFVKDMCGQYSIPEDIVNDIVCISKKCE